MKLKSESEVAQCVQPSVTAWTAAYQAPLSMGFSRQEYCSGVPLPSPAINVISHQKALGFYGWVNYRARTQAKFLLFQYNYHMPL